MEAEKGMVATLCIVLQNAWEFHIRYVNVSVSLEKLQTEASKSTRNTETLLYFTTAILFLF